MTLGIRGTFEFADYESGVGGFQKPIYILVVLLTYVNTFLNILSFINIINWLYY